MENKRKKGSGKVGENKFQRMRAGGGKLEREN